MLATEVYQLLVQPAFAHSLNDEAVILPAGGRHFQVQPGLNTFHTVVGCAPVAHHVAVEAPVLAQHVGQKPAVLTGVGAVNPVVTAHHRPGFCLLHGGFEGGKVNFAQGTLIHYAVAAHPAVLLAVAGKVLHAGAHTAALYALDKPGRRFARQIGVFAEVLKVAPAKRRTLDVHRGAQDHGNLLVLAGVAHRFAKLAEHIPVK